VAAVLGVLGVGLLALSLTIIRAGAGALGADAGGGIADAAEAALGAGRLARQQAALPGLAAVAGDREADRARGALGMAVLLPGGDQEVGVGG
jgi:hypothetical protein